MKPDGHPFMKLIGLTGGIATGKTLVANLLKKKKIPVIDADAIARKVVKPGTKAYQEIVATFGLGVVNKDKTLNRQTLGQIVFRDERRRRILESIAHPQILREIEAAIRGFRRRKAPLVVVDAALLFESGLSEEMDQTIVVTCHPKVQLKRLMKRDRFSETEAWTRILAQMPTARKIKKADFVIDNSGTQSQTERQVLKILEVAGLSPRPRRRAAVSRGP